MRAMFASNLGTSSQKCNHLTQAQCHYTCSDLLPVSRFLDDLAAELLRRMNAANVSGGEAALRLLTQLLFASDDG